MTTRTTSSSSSRCIAGLTRGYANIHEYKTLIERNQAIQRNLADKTIPLLIFHEGNILEQHQKHIQQATPFLHLYFINIRTNNLAFRTEKESEPYILNMRCFNMGYRHMCSFWFVDFWHFVQEYDALIRIDEDCQVNCSLDTMFAQMHNFTSTAESPSIITGVYQEDDDMVCVGLNPFTLNFMSESRATLVPKRPSGGPYTNLMGMRLDKIRANPTVLKYIRAVDESSHIYHHRWGDLPLWGEVITYILGEHAMKVDPTIQYYHGSHYRHVNAIVDKEEYSSGKPSEYK